MQMTIDIGGDRQLFVDHLLVEREQGVQLKLHPPVVRETFWRPEMPWRAPIA